MKVKEDTMSAVDTRKGAVTYSRVSSEGQIDGFSLDVQVRETRKAAEKLGCTVMRSFVEEGVSGTLEDRPALTEMLAFCAKHMGEVRYVIVKDIDRFSRETLVHQVLRGKLKELGVTLYSINQPSIADEGPHARFMENIFSSVAQLERDQIVQRCMSGTKEAVLNGAWTCRAPYGYEHTKTSDGTSTLKIHAERAEVVRKIFQLYAEGMMITDIADKLRALGYSSMSERKFSKQTIFNMLRNPTFIGKIRHRQFPDQLIDGLHPAIVSLELWEAVQARFDNRHPFAKKLKVNPEFMLTNILRCPECAGPMTGAFSKGKSGKRYPYYSCRLSGCKARTQPRETVELGFLEAMENLKPTDECIRIFEESIITVWREKWQDEVSEKTRLVRQLTELEQRRDSIVDKYVMGKLDEFTYKRSLSRVDDEIMKVGQLREGHMLSEEQMRGMLQFARSFLTSPLNTWKEATLERKRLIQRLVFPVGLRLEKDGSVRTLEVSPLLKLLDNLKGADTPRSSLVDQIRLSWNTLIPSLAQMVTMLRGGVAA